MKKNLIVLSFSFILIFLFISCKNNGSMSGADPKAVLIAFFERMSNKDLEGAAKLATKESKSTIDLMKKAIDMGESMKDKIKDEKTEEKDPVEEFKKMKIGEAKINGDMATVSVTNPSKNNETFDFPLKKEDGSWKVDFSMGTLMKMGMDKDKEMNSDDIDLDTTNSMEKLNKMMNADSLKIGLEKIDSIMKAMDPEKMKAMKDAIKDINKTSEN